MNRRQFAIGSAAGLSLSTKSGNAAKANGVEAREVFPGIWRISFGAAESNTPVTARSHPPAADELRQLPRVPACPVDLQNISVKASKRGCQFSFPLAANELVYGLGLQFHSFLQRGLKKTLRVNADPKMDTGDSHAPVPFYVTSHGYGIFVDTLRYATFYCGNKVKHEAGPEDVRPTTHPVQTAGALPAEYSRIRLGQASDCVVEIPEARGADVYVVGGPTTRLAVQRYNLFSGGGALPPRWGLGFWYRCHLAFAQQDVLSLAAEFRQRGIACDVLGLEPGWQTHSYSCSYVWSNKFPSPGTMLAKLKEESYRLNLWEHAYIHPSSPLYSEMKSVSGDYLVWDGLAPDFLDPRARSHFADFHDKQHVSLGVAGYKLDECDNSDFTGNWSFPELSRFPSGVDGEQMHSCFGLRYQDTIDSIFRRRQQRTYSLVRSSHALAAPYPFVLYSDLYDHREFIRALVNSGFSGLLWCPEVRDAESEEDLLRRLQTTVFSPLAMVNAWYIKNPPWKQVNGDKNNAGTFAPDWEKLEAHCRDLITLRMRLVPYLHSAFVRYRLEGLPPFRALVMDYPDDPQTWSLDTQYLVGDSLLVAPLVAGEREKRIYLPAGNWFNFASGQRIAGGQHTTVTPSLQEIPVFVKDGTLLPLAEPTLHTDDPGSFKLTVRVYGDGAEPATLYEESGGVDPKIAKLALQWDPKSQSGSVSRSGSALATGYDVTRWQRIS